VCLLALLQELHLLQELQELSFSAGAVLSLFSFSDIVLFGFIMINKSMCTD